MRTTNTRERPGGVTRPDVPSLLLSALLLVMGVTVVVDAAGVEAPPGAGAVGPAAFPWAIGAALLVLGVLLGLVSLRGRPDEELTPVLTAPSELAPLGVPADPGESAEERVGDDAPPAVGDRAVGEVEPWLRARPAVRVLVLVAGLLVHAAVIRTAGYVVAALVLFVAAAVAFGAPRLLRTIAVGAVLTLVIFYSFTVGLGLGLPDLGGG
jgi:putative tricarboxylic transport membrane protein